MNRYTVIYKTKSGKEIISPEITTPLSIKEVRDKIFDDINRDSIFIESDTKYEVIFKGNIEGFEVTQY